jgi:anionic cell wall polymer biosynthesis LytR-Cps2A-Psr (LCP) family protein
MDGATAGKYVRFRSDELGDIGRVQRQQKFLKAAAEQMFSFQNITKIGAIMDTIDKYIDTDLNTVTMFKAANSFKIFGDIRLKPAPYTVNLMKKMVLAIGQPIELPYRKLWMS